MKHITKIKEIIEEIVISENNDKTEYLVNFRTNEKTYTDYQWDGERKILTESKGGTSKEDDLKTYLNTIDEFNQKRKVNYLVNMKDLTDRQVLDLYIERVESGRIMGDRVKGE